MTIFDCVDRNRVAHVFNSWSAMPPVSEQIALPKSVTNPALVTARFLLKPGRKYEHAVKSFQPYDRIREENPDARTAAAFLITERMRYEPRRKTHIYVNNRLEGNAPLTLESFVSMIQRREEPSGQ